MAEIARIAFHLVMAGFDAVWAGFVQPVRADKFLEGWRIFWYSSKIMRFFQIQWKRGVAGGFSAVLLTLLTAGCSSFNRDWKAAASMPVQSGDLQGRWQGRWISKVNGHNGDLRCIVTKTGNEIGAYRARFRATYAGTIKFGYTVPLRAERKDGNFVFSGDANLGWLKGGVYHYEGHADGTNFFSTYRCKYDHGTFQMGRP